MASLYFICSLICLIGSCIYMKRKAEFRYLPYETEDILIMILGCIIFPISIVILVIGFLMELIKEWINGD